MNGDGHKGSFLYAKTINVINSFENDIYFVLRKVFLENAAQSKPNLKFMNSKKEVHLLPTGFFSPPFDVHIV